jgi:hypothetical protein
MSREDRGEDVFHDDVDLLVILPGDTTPQAQDESRAYRCLRGVPASINRWVANRGAHVIMVSDDPAGQQNQLGSQGPLDPW